MEPYSADKIKRRKRKYYNLGEELYPLVNDKNIIIPFKLAFREFNTIYDGLEKMPFHLNLYAINLVLINYLIFFYAVFNKR